MSRVLSRSSCVMVLAICTLSPVGSIAPTTRSELSRYLGSDDFVVLEDVVPVGNDGWLSLAFTPVEERDYPAIAFKEMESDPSVIAVARHAVVFHVGNDGSVLRHLTVGSGKIMIRDWTEYVAPVATDRAISWAWQVRVPPAGRCCAISLGPVMPHGMTDAITFRWSEAKHIYKAFRFPPNHPDL